MSQVASRIKSFGQTYSMELILFPIIIMVILGTVGNNMSASGIQSTPTFTTSHLYPVGIVVPNSENGCDQATANCNISTISAFSFLNQNSPFTYLLQGDIIGFVNSWSSNGAQSQSTNFIYTTGCILQTPTQGFCTGGTVHWATTNNAYIVDQPFNFTSVGGNDSQFQIIGTAANNVNQLVQFSIYGGYWANGTGIVFVNPQACQVNLLLCKSINPYAPSVTVTCPTEPALDAYATQYCLAALVGNYIQNNTALQFGTLGAMLGFIMGTVLLLLSLGLYLSGSILSTGFSAGNNEQGTRLAQVLGIGLIVWSFIYSEFGYIFTAWSLSLGTVAFIALAGMSFIGMYWRMLSLD